MYMTRDRGLGYNPWAGAYAFPGGWEERGISDEVLVQLSPDQQHIFLDTPQQMAKERMRDYGVEITHQAGLTDYQVFYENLAYNATIERVDKRIKYLQNEYNKVQDLMYKAESYLPHVTSQAKADALTAYVNRLVGRAERIGDELSQRQAEQQDLIGAWVLGTQAVQTPGFKLEPVTTREMIRPERTYTMTRVVEPPGYGLRELPGWQPPKQAGAGREGPSRHVADLFRPRTETFQVKQKALYQQKEGITQVGDPRQLQYGEEVVYSPFLESGSVLVKKSALRDPGEVDPAQVVKYGKGQAVYGSLLAGVWDTPFSPAESKFLISLAAFGVFMMMMWEYEPYPATSRRRRRYA